MQQTLHRIQPEPGTAHPEDVYHAELQKLIDGPEEVIGVVQIDAAMPRNPVLLVMCNTPTRRKTTGQGQESR